MVSSYGVGCLSDGKTPISIGSSVPGCDPPAVYPAWTIVVMASSACRV